MNFKTLGFYSFFSINDGLKLFFNHQNSNAMKIINNLSYLFFPLVKNLNSKNAKMLKNVFETTNNNIFLNYPDKEYLKNINKNFVISLKKFILKNGNKNILDFFIFYFIIFFILPIKKINDFNKFYQIIENYVFTPKNTGSLEIAYQNGLQIIKKIEIEENPTSQKIALIIGLFQEFYYLGIQKSYFDTQTDQKLFRLSSLINNKNILICQNYPYVLFLLIYHKKKFFSNELLEILNQIQLFNIQCFNLELIHQYLQDKNIIIQLCDLYDKT